MKNKFLILLSIIAFFALLFGFFRNVYYYNYCEKTIAEGNIEIKLINVIGDNELNYKINENVNIINEIQEIMSCKYSDESFLRGKFYLIYVFKLSDKRREINMEVKIHDINPVVQLRFDINGATIFMYRNIKDFDVINRIKKELILNGNDSL